MFLYGIVFPRAKDEHVAGIDGIEEMRRWFVIIAKTVIGDIDDGAFVEADLLGSQPRQLTKEDFLRRMLYIFRSLSRLRGGYSYMLYLFFSLLSQIPVQRSECQRSCLHVRRIFDAKILAKLYKNPTLRLKNQNKQQKMRLKFAYMAYKYFAYLMML